MTWTRPSTRFAVAGYVLVALLVLGSLSWATVVSLRSQRAERQARHQARYHSDLALALRRMDSRVQSALTRETSRSPYDYSSVHHPVLLWNSSGGLVRGDRFNMVSPLVDYQLEDWLLLHFQVSPDQEWTSPQVPSDNLLALVGLNLPPKVAVNQAIEWLRVVRQSLTPDRLAELLAEGRARDLLNAPWREAGAPDETSLALEEPPQRAPAHRRERASILSASRPRMVRSDYERRKRQTEQALEDSLAPETCSPSGLALVNLNQPQVASAELGDSEWGSELCIIPSGMTAVWLELVGHEGTFLAFVRTVPIEGESVSVLQGFLVDWGLLKGRLLAEVADLFPEADLVPVRSGRVEDSETLMAWLPARFETSADDVPPSEGGWSATHSGLAWAWGAAIVLLIGIAVGVRSLLALAERRMQFAYAVSHELRTPLTTLRLYTDMLAGGLVPEERRGEYVQTLNDQSQRLSQLVEGVLEYSRLEHRSAALAPANTTVGGLLESARERFETGCEQAGHQLVVDADGAADLPWQTDPNLALQIMGILIDNACKHAGQAEDPRIILSAAASTPGKVCIEVRDFGPGVPRNERRRIFQPFRRGRGAVSSAGIGLGLALASRWTGLLGGRLRLVTDRRRQPGACFRLVFPAAWDASAG